MKLKTFVFALSIGFILLFAVGCAPLQTSSASSSSQSSTSKVDLTFSLNSDFNFGNDRDGYYPVTAVYLSGSFNGWPEFENAIEMTKNGSRFSTTVTLTKGKDISFKYIVSTTATNGIWWTDMRDCYDNVGIDPWPVTYENDSFGGVNAVYTP